MKLLQLKCLVVTLQKNILKNKQTTEFLKRKKLTIHERQGGKKADRGEKPKD